MRRDRGAALVFAILVLGIIVAVATSLADDFFLTLRRTENEILGRQAREYLLSAEQLAVIRLASDEDTGADHLAEAWAADNARFEIDGGWLHCTLEDLQGRFNLNALRGVRSEANAREPAPATEPERRLLRVLRAAGGDLVDEQKARELVEQLIDWLDADDEPTRFGGAESSYYSGLADPVRVPNRAMYSVSELRMLPAMTPELYDLLQPFLASWPQAGGTINVNTASPALLSAIVETEDFSPDTSTVEDMLAAREEHGYGSLQEFAASTGRRGGIPLGGLSLKSDWYLLQAEVFYGQIYWRMESVLERRGPEVYVRARSFGGL